MYVHVYPPLVEVTIICVPSRSSVSSADAAPVQEQESKGKCNAAFGVSAHVRALCTLASRAYAGCRIEVATPSHFISANRKITYIQYAIFRGMFAFGKSFRWAIHGPFTITSFWSGKVSIKWRSTWKRMLSCNSRT